MKTRMLFCFFCSAMFSVAGMADTLDFKNNAEGWVSVSGVGSNFSWSYSSTGKAGKPCAIADIGRALINHSADYRYNGELENIACDNVCITVELFNEETVDSLQVIGSTNNWVNVFEIGSSFKVYDENATVNDWRTSASVSRYLPGISKNKNLKVGIRAISGNRSFVSINVSKLEVSYRASATPGTPYFSNADGEDAGLPKPNESLYIAVNAPPLPSDNVIVTNVNVVLTRPQGVETNVLKNKAGSSVWISEATISPVFDAGEQLKMTATSRYYSKDNKYETLGDNGEETSGEFSRLISGKGCVWINEFGKRDDSDDYWLEIAGVVSRSYVEEGWMAILAFDVVSYTNELDTFTWNSSTNNGVGFQCFKWTGLPSAGTATLSLINSAGVCESIRGPFSVSTLHGAVNYLPNLGDSVEEWEGATDLLEWKGMDTETFGRVNPGEGFRKHVDSRVKVRAFFVDDEHTTNGVAFAKVEVTAWEGFATETTKAAETKDDSNPELRGWTDPIQFSADHHDVTSMPMRVIATGFGWASEPISTDLGTNATLEVEMNPSVGYEDFELGFPGYLKNLTSYEWVAGSGCMAVNARRLSAGQNAQVTVKNNISTRRKSYARLSYSVKNVSTDMSGNADNVDANLQFTDAEGITTPKVYNKNSDVPLNSWIAVSAFAHVPSVDNIKSLTINGNSGHRSDVWIYLDELRLAFQDSVEVSELTVATNAVTEGQTAAAFSAVVTPLATEEGTKNVSVDFVLNVEGKEIVVPCDWSNAVAVAGGAAYDGSGRTNTLEKALKFTATTNDVSAALEAATGDKWFGTGDNVDYYVCAHYYADSNDPDKSKEWEERYYPDNHKVDENGVWYVIGDYEPVATNLTITGPALSFIGDPTPTSDGFSFDFRAFSADGDIVSNGVTVAGVTTSFVADTKTKVMDSSFTWGGDPLAANENYTVKLILWKENGTSVTRDMKITTLGTAATPTLQGRSANSLTVKADGCKATQIEISCNGEAKWINLGESADFNGLNPDCAYDVTVVAVKNSAGVVAETAAKATFYTLPNKPTANVTETPGWDFHTISVAELVDAEFRAFGNPSNTVYAFYVVNIDKKGDAVATHWLGEKSGVIQEIESEKPKWLTIAEWDKQAFQLSLTTTETNDLYLVAGGRSPLPNGRQAVNGYEPTETGPAQTINITLIVEPVREAVRNAYDPARHDDTYGFVTFTNRVMSPFADGVADVAIAYEFATDDNEATWSPLSIDSVKSIMTGGATPTANANKIENVLSADCASNVVELTWNSANDLDLGKVYKVKIRATVADNGVHTAVAKDVPLAGGKMDFEPPTPTIKLTDPLPVNGNYTSVNSQNATVEGAEAYRYKTGSMNDYASTGTAISLTGLAENENTLSVIGRDEWGNWTPEESPAVANWIVDTITPVVTIKSTGGAAALYAATIPYEVDIVELHPDSKVLNVGDFKVTLIPEQGSASSGAITNLKKKDVGLGYTFDIVSPDAAKNGPVTVKVELAAGKVKDLAGNGNVAVANDSVVSDRTPPKVTITTDAADINNLPAISYKIAIASASAVTNEIAVADINVPSGYSVVGLTPGAKNERGVCTNYTFNVTTVDGKFATMVVGLPAGKVSNLAGTPNAAAAANEVVSDREKPSVTLTYAAPATNNLDGVVYTVTFADGVGMPLDSGIKGGTIRVVSGTMTTPVKDGSSTAKKAVWTFTVKPKEKYASEIVSVSIDDGAVVDLAGNTSKAVEQVKFLSDRVKPTAKIVEPAAFAFTNNLGKVTGFTLELDDANFKDPVVKPEWFDCTDCEILDVASQDTKKKWTFSVKPTTEGGEVKFSIKADCFDDYASNSNEVSNCIKYVYDKTGPAATIAVPDGFAFTNNLTTATGFFLTLSDANFKDPGEVKPEWFDCTNCTVQAEKAVGDSSGRTWSLTVTPSLDGEVKFCLKANCFDDYASNSNKVSTWITYVFDSVSPTAAITAPNGFAYTNNQETTEFFTLKLDDLNFKDPGTVTAEWFERQNCTITDITGVGKDWKFKVSPINDGEVKFNLKADRFDDYAGNSNTVSKSISYVYDHTPPSVTIRPDGVGDRTFVKEIPFKVTVRDDHEVITALTAASFTISATNEANDVIGDAVIVAGSFTNDGNTNYTFRVSSPEKALEGPVWISVKLNTAVEDVVGNQSALPEGGVISDRTQPGVAIWTIDAASTNNDAVINYELSIASFSPITNKLTTADITVPSGCKVLSIAGNGEPVGDGIYTNYSFTVETPTSGDTLMLVTLPAGSVFNSAGNSNDVAVANTIMSDHTAPVPVLTCGVAALTNNLEKIPFTINVVETNGLAAGAAIVKEKIKVTNGKVNVENFNSAAYSCTFEVIPDGDGEVTVQVLEHAISDFAGNLSVASEVVAFVSDRTEPTATMATTTDLSLPRKDDTIEFTVALADTQKHLSAEGNYLSTESFVPANCTVTKVEGKGLNYTVRVSPISDGEVAIGVKGGAFKDAAENTNKASKVMSFISDRTKPVVKIDGLEVGMTKSRHFEMKVKATDTPETTNVVWYSWSVKGNGQSFGEDFTEITTNEFAILRGTGLNDGVWNWTVKFKDIAGNVATTNGSWAVKSDVAPKLALDPTTGMVEGSPAQPLVFTLTVPENDIELTKKFDTNMVVHVSGGQVFYRRAIKIEGDSLATITLTPVKQDRDFTDVVTLTIPCGAAIGTNGIAAATVSGTVTYKFSGTNKNPEAVRVVRAAGGYLDDPHRTNANLGEITLIAKTLNGAKFKSGFSKTMVSGAKVKSVTVASDRLSVTITLAADAMKQLVDVDGWKGFKLAFAGGSVESLPSPIPAGSQVTVPVKVWRNLARVAGADGAAIKVDEADAPLAHDGDARTAQVEGSAKLAATFPRARVNAVYVRLSAASAKDAYKPTKATVTLKRAGQTVETIVTDLVWDGKRCAPVDLLVTPQDTLLAEAVADEAALSFTGSTKALYLDEFAVFGLPEALDPLCPEVLSVNPVEGGFVVQTDMGVSNWVTVASDQALKLESDGVTTGVAIDWAQIGWVDATRTALKVPISGSADAGYVGGATLHVYEGFLGNFIGRSNICETISTTNLSWNSQTAPEAVSFMRYDGAGESVAFDADALMWTLMFNQPVLNLSGASFDKHDALGSVQVLGTGSPTNYIVRAQLNCWTNEVSDVKVTLKAGAVKGLTGKSNEAATASETYKLGKVKVIE